MLNGSDNNIFRRLARRLALALAVLFALAGSALAVIAYGVTALFVLAVLAVLAAVGRRQAHEPVNEWGVHRAPTSAPSIPKFKPLRHHDPRNALAKAPESDDDMFENPYSYSYSHSSHNTWDDYD